MSSEETTVQPRQMRIDITSDVICPFCLLGVKQLLDGISQYNQTHSTTPIEPHVRLLPYCLDRTLTDEPEDRATRLKAKFGERADGMRTAMKAKFAELGYDMAIDGEVSSSHTAHRLQTYALLHNPSKQLNLAMDILEAYHVQGHYPSDIDVLSDLAVKYEIFPSKEEATEWLRGGEMDTEVQQAYGVARRLGVTGVPFFVFQDKWAASGAMGTDEFVGLLEEITRRESESSSTPSPTSTAVSPNQAVQKHEERREQRKEGGEACT